MDVTIIGTGHMARAIATRFATGRASVKMLAHEAESEASAAADEVRATVPGAHVATGMVGEPIESEVVVLAVPFAGVSEIARRYPDGFADRILVDITNPVAPDFEGLSTPPDTSAAEQVARMFAGATVVKAFNTAFASTVLVGEVAGQPLDIFIAADDVEAKAAVSVLIEAGGMRALDAGPLRRARQLEQLAFLHMTMQGPLGTGYASAIKVIP